MLLCLLLALQAAVCARAAEWAYRVRPGDTLWDLAALHMRRDIDWRQLQAHNRIADPYRLPPGTRLRFPVKWLRVQPQDAVIVALRGEVTVRAGPGAPPAAAHEGMRLRIGAVLETGDDASATVRFADRSRTLVMSGSRVEFDQLSAYGATGMVDTRMRLQRGRASSRVTPARGPASRFIVETPSATSSVRGTVFRVAAVDTAASSTEVLEGRVSVRSDGAGVELSQGHGARTGAAKGDRPTVQPLLPAPRFEAPPAEAHGAAEIAWAALPGAERYRVLVGEAAEPDALQFERTTSARRIRLPALPAGDYLVEVRGIAANGLEGVDARHRLRILPGPSAPIALRVSDANGQVTVPRPRFGWAEVEGAADYRAQIARDGGFSDLVDETGTLRATRWRASRDLPPGVYHWRVVARDAEGNEGAYSASERFEVVPAPPRELQVGDDERILRWQAAGAEGVRYRVQVARRADFAKLAIDRVVEAPEVDLRGLGGGRWHVRVQAVEADGYAAPFDPAQTIRLPCRWCKAAAAAAGLLLLTL